MAKVKFYSWGTGKTTACKNNKNLIDGDTIMHQLTPKDKALEIIKEWKSNSSNKRKTLLVSTKSLIGLDVFDNVPMAPSKEEFLKRMQESKGMPKNTALKLYNYLLEHCPNLRIDDRFVSEIEGKKEE